MEIQIGQIVQEVHRRLQEGLPSDTIVKPNDKEQCNTITLRSGKELRGIEIEKGQNSSTISELEGNVLNQESIGDEKQEEEAAEEQIGPDNEQLTIEVRTNCSDN